MTTLLVVGACSSDSDTSPTTVAEAPTTTGLELPCTDADPADVAAIAGVLKGDARALSEAYTYNDGPYRVVMADVLDDQGERLESAETWVFINGGLRAVSSDAADLSMVSKLRIEDENGFRTVTGYDVFEVGSALGLGCRAKG
ncbi:hypothetical protein [Dermatobacter hominis]|uniref:hypothetical protein n=1 Tax=Dermatobacter hominis TaxID=2884263 RepID=UPI001D11B6E8|nr:hypothetical protein [Dermatobacter hominis]UDY36298.1 hypothetical protein LH044_01895 [Dermatobacter hominis]